MNWREQKKLPTYLLYLAQDSWRSFSCLGDLTEWKALKAFRIIEQNHWSWKRALRSESICQFIPTRPTNLCLSATSPRTIRREYDNNMWKAKLQQLKTKIQINKTLITEISIVSKWKFRQKLRGRPSTHGAGSGLKTMKMLWWHLSGFSSPCSWLTGCCHLQSVLIQSSLIRWVMNKRTPSHFQKPQV